MFKGSFGKLCSFPFGYFHRLLFLIFPFIFAFCSFSVAGKEDSLVLFSRLHTADPRQQLTTLQAIYGEFYAFYPLKGHPYMMKSLILARKLKDKKAEAEAYYAISSYYRKRNMFDSSFYFCRAGLDISTMINSGSLTAKGYSVMGHIYLDKGEKIKALDLLKKALTMDSTNETHVASCCYGLGLLYADAGCYDKSVYYYLTVLRIKEKENLLIDAAYLYCNLSGFYFQSHNGNEGFKSFEKALSLFRQEKYLKGEGYVYNLIGSRYYEQKEYDSAMKYYRKSLAINSLDTFTIRSGYSFNLTNIGDTWLKLKRYDSAGYYYTRALNFSSRDQDYIPMACTYLSMGELNMMLKKYPEAIRMLDEGLYYSKLANFRSQWEQAYNLLSTCYEASGDQVKALYYLKLRNAVKDSIFSLKAQQEVANMMIRYETDKKVAQIKQLDIESREKQKKIRIAGMIILLIVVVAGMAGCFLWLYYRRHLKPKVRALRFIQEKVTLEKAGDNRRLKTYNKILPPELKPIADKQSVQLNGKEDLITRLEELMIKEKIYLNEDLTLADTAQMLDSNTAYLSRLINEHYSFNFSAFINGYRVEEARRMILDDHFNNFSMEGISKSAGFRSKSTFNHVFKQVTGLTPTGFALRNGRKRA